MIVGNWCKRREKRKNRENIRKNPTCFKLDFSLFIFNNVKGYILATTTSTTTATAAY